MDGETEDIEPHFRSPPLFSRAKLQPTHMNININFWITFETRLWKIKHEEESDSLLPSLLPPPPTLPPPQSQQQYYRWRGGRKKKSILSNDCLLRATYALPVKMRMQWMYVSPLIERMGAFSMHFSAWSCTCTQIFMRTMRVFFSFYFLFVKLFIQFDLGPSSSVETSWEMQHTCIRQRRGDRKNKTNCNWSARNPRQMNMNTIYIPNRKIIIKNWPD